MADWEIKYDKYIPAEEQKREALCALGNGYFCIRSAMEETSADNKHHYPGTYLAGGYNRLVSEVAGKQIENEDLVNWPNGLHLRFKRKNSEKWIHPDEVEILDFSQILDLKHGLLHKKIHLKDEDDNETLVESTRFVHLQYFHIAGVQWRLTPLNWEGNVIIESGIDGDVENAGVERYSDLAGNHTEVLNSGFFENDGQYLKCRTKQSDIKMALAVKTTVESPDIIDRAVAYKNIQHSNSVAQQLEIKTKKNQALKINKYLSIFTSRDFACTEPLREAQKEVISVPEIEQLIESQKRSWEDLWRSFDTAIDSDRQDQLLIRLHGFHVLQTANKNIIGLDVGIPSRGWTGEAYRGHILWDEIFVFPLLNISLPEVARSLLFYRYRRLSEARRAAHNEGFQGAMFPWQSSSNGREESQKIHLNPQSGNWIPDNTRFQRHVNCAIVYNVWKYYEASRDVDFLLDKGAEMILDIAQFLAGKTIYNSDRKKYEIHKIVGPDEYHTSYPDSDEPGLKNNAYTNVFVIWVLNRALELYDILEGDRLDFIMKELDITYKQKETWDHIRQNMYVPFQDGTNIIEQFEGFEQLEELDWDHYHEKHGEILRLDRILEGEGDSVNRYKAVKQADLLMLFYLFSTNELTELFEQSGYEFNKDILNKNLEYYHKRTSHGSTLSKLVHSWVYARNNREKSWANFEKALISDFKDIQGGTTPEGIHLGAMAGTIDMIQRCYTGLELRKGKIWFDPQLPDSLNKIAFRFRYQRQWMHIELTSKALTLKAEGIWHHAVEVCVFDEFYELKEGDVKTFNCDDGCLQETANVKAEQD